MEKVLDKGYAYDGVGYQLRLYQDPAGQEKPLFIMEPRDGHEEAFNEKRAELAEHLTARLGKTPDQVEWLEQGNDGSLREFDFGNAIKTVADPTGGDMPLEEVREAQRAGELPSNEGTFVPSLRLGAEQVKELEAKTGETIDPFIDRQNREFANWSLSPQAKPPEIDMEPER